MIVHKLSVGKDLELGTTREKDFSDIGIYFSLFV